MLQSQNNEALGCFVVGRKSAPHLLACQLRCSANYCGMVLFIRTGCFIDYDVTYGSFTAWILEA